MTFNNIWKQFSILTTKKDYINILIKCDKKKTERERVQLNNVLANAMNSILSLKQIPFSCRSRQDKLTIKELGPPGSNLNTKQVTLSTKSGKTCNRGFSRSWYERKKWLAGCDVANALYCYPCISFYLKSCKDIAWTTTGVTDM